MNGNMIKPEEKSYELVFDNAKLFLSKMTPRDINIKEYLQRKRKFSSFEDIFERLIESLVNRGMMPKVIKFNERKAEFKKILYDFDTKRILLAYASEDYLMEEFKKYFEIKNVQSNRNSWRILAKGIISGSKFLSSFNNKDDFDKFINNFTLNEYTKEALPMLLAREIDGFGFALACDFLKELGYRDYPKPDVHLIKIFSELKLSTAVDYEVYKAIIRMSKVVGEDAYVVDKYFWLISTGKFYPDPDNLKREVRVGGKRDEFIQDTKIRLS